ncbi:lysylphosphatidylglycerol synthase transmembrane domain-containing protein [Wenzhouxiangella sediminis]|uniref:UPF0104 family protein n=1 Tax=Wenzhouxiangella sediminis TaxID=1792836 RepID=A0A3E1K764_9GAMM|nr:lysylphosphatidylglycerol synthase transmembrane domain-containing protein [Wenzhouxiangella sediminis]RFF29524.1 UPF0104 family protein [Wenzhouxiangella sediminis]
MSERRQPGPSLRWLISLAVLAALLWWLDPARVAAQVTALSPGWLAAALVVTVVQVLLSAWRWRFTASRLGLALSRTRALADYYLAMFVNQVLPGGVLGDALRAHRHACHSGAVGPAWRAVLIERFSGQLVVALGTAGVLLFMPLWRDALAALWPERVGVWMAAAAVLGLSAIALSGAARRFPQGWRDLRADLYRAMLAPSAWPRQLAASLAVVCSYALVFALAARGIGVGLDFAVLLAVGLPVLLAMLIPFSVAGWGFREAAAAAVWLALGLPGEQGVAVAMTYGAINLVGALPGAVVLARRPLQSWRAR